MQAGRRVVVANTHVRLWEMAAVIGCAPCQPVVLRA